MYVRERHNPNYCEWWKHTDEEDEGDKLVLTIFTLTCDWIEQHKNHINRVQLQSVCCSLHTQFSRVKWCFDPIIFEFSLNFSTFPFHEKIYLWMWIENKKNIFSAKIELIQWKQKLNWKSSAKFNDKIKTEKIEAKKINFVNSTESNLSNLVKRLISLCKFHFIFVHWRHWVKSTANQNVRFYGFTFASSHRPRHRSAANAAMFTRYLSAIKPNSLRKLMEHFCRRMMWFHSYAVAYGSMLRHVHRTNYDNYWLDRSR